MLSYNFIRLFKIRNINRPFSYLVKKGYSDNFATRVANNRVYRLNLDDIEKLCEIFNCTPNDLMQWIPDKSQQDMNNHPLAPLRRTEKVSQINTLLNTIPLDKLNEIESLIMKEMEK